MKLSRRGFGAGALAIVAGGCGSRTALQGEGDDVGPGLDTSPDDQSPAPPNGFEPAPAVDDPGIAFDPSRSPLVPPAAVWSWTTAEQAAELRRDRVLYTRGSSPTLGRGRLFEVLAERASRGDATAAALDSASTLEKGRFGWTNPWATVLGATPGETYGTELLRIELRPDTWWARLRLTSDVIDFVDATGASVPTAKALAAMDRVGGILFDHDVETFQVCGTGSGEGALLYREIYLANEARVARASHRTKETSAAIASAGDELDALLAWMASQFELPRWSRFDFACRALEVWRRGGAGTFERYVASLAFATEPYLPAQETVARIVGALRERRFTVSDPFELVP